MCNDCRSPSQKQLLHDEEDFDQFLENVKARSLSNKQGETRHMSSAITTVFMGALIKNERTGIYFCSQI